MIFRYPEQEQIYNDAPAALQQVFRELENVLLEYAVEPIVFRVIPASTGPMTEDKRRIEIMAGPYQFTDRMVTEAQRRLQSRFGLELIFAHRKRFGQIPERIILEIPQTWVDEPRVFLAKFGYIKGGYHA